MTSVEEEVKLEHKLETPWCFWFNSRVRTEKTIPYSEKLKNLGK